MPNVKVGGTIAVQVAAVTKEEDADALVSALRGKNYPVFVVSNVPGDKLFHVQVGPFAELKDAETVRARLSSDGYNPIIKK
jgi:cell division septation protein DedD